MWSTTTRFHALSRLLALALIIAASANKPHVLLLQVLDSHGLRDALQFLTGVSSAPHHASTNTVIFISKPHFDSADKDVQQAATNSSKHSLRYYSRSTPLPDRSIGRKTRVEERVTFLLDGLNATLHDRTNSDTEIVSLAFKKGTAPRPLPAFAEIYQLGHKNRSSSSATSSSSSSSADAKAALLMPPSIYLLGKNKRLSSVSDWHDLAVLKITASPAARAWLDTLISVYYHHADRAAFSLLEPRPAILEAGFRHSASVGVGHFIKGQICRQHTAATDKVQEGGLAMDHCLQHQSFLSMECSDAPESDVSPCHQLDEPISWKAKIDRNVVANFEQRPPFLKKDTWSTKMHEAIWTGSLRYRHPLDAKTPRPFCWETNLTMAGAPKSTENLAESRIYSNFTDSRPYIHPPNARDAAAIRASARLKIVLMTGAHAGGVSLESKLHMQISKMMYCKRHGYTFLQLLSNQFTGFFPLDLYGAVRAEMSHTGYFRGLMSKTLMMADALLRHPQSDWVIWTDDDVYINPGWLYLPMDAFLGPDVVPADKVYVSANYRSAFTNVFAVRNNEQGRRLVYDWIAVAMSGHVQCHGFDQAAIGTLLLTRVYGMGEAPTVQGAASPSSPSSPSSSSSSTASRGIAPANAVPYDPFPFNHTCTWSDEGSSGCNSKGDWSCDFKVEASLYRAGFKTRMANFYGQKISSYTKGCANHVIADFHVITEDEARPRWQCGLCSRLYEVESAGHWDGPLGGGNDLLRRGAVNGWFFGHKGEFLFYEAYLHSDNCLAVQEAAPPCEPALLAGLGLGVGVGVGSGAETGAGGDREKERGTGSGGTGSARRGVGSSGGQGSAGGPGGQSHRSLLGREARGVGVGHTHHHGQNNAMSLIDGYVFDIDAGRYCRPSPSEPALLASLLQYQRGRTYMKDYPELIKAASAYTNESWRDAYQSFSGGEGRDSCMPRDPKDTGKCEHGWGSDGQKNRRKRPGEDEDNIFERAPTARAYCTDECRTITRSHKPFIQVVDCRSPKDAEAETSRKINLVPEQDY